MSTEDQNNVNTPSQTDDKNSFSGDNDTMLTNLFKIIRSQNSEKVKEKNKLKAYEEVLNNKKQIDFNYEIIQLKNVIMSCPNIEKIKYNLNVFLPSLISSTYRYL